MVLKKNIFGYQSTIIQITLDICWYKQTCNDFVTRLSGASKKGNVRTCATLNPHLVVSRLASAATFLDAGHITNQIDLRVIQRRYQKIITNITTFRGADTSLDHFLVGINVKIRNRPKEKENGTIENNLTSNSCAVQK